MSRNCVLAIDAGSSGCRASIFDLQGVVVSSAQQTWAYDMPAQIAPLGRDFNPQDFWNIICGLINQAITKSAVAPSQIAAVSAASQRQGVVFLDSEGNELYAGPNTDLRALAEGFSIDSEFGSDIHRITGHTPSFLFTPAKLRWFKINYPHVYGQIATVLSINNWIIHRLCGKSFGELSSAADIGMVDVRAAGWSGQLPGMLDMPQTICPEMRTAGTCAGEVTTAVSAQTGLAAGTLVVIGGGDTQCALLGIGAKDQAQVGIVAGWSASVQMVTTEPIIDPQGRIWSGCHVLPGRWILESNAGVAGGAYAWLKSLLFDDDTSNAARDPYAFMDYLAEMAPLGAEGVLAFIGPRVMDMTRLKPGLGGFILPITPSVTGIERKHLIRAAMENLCFAFKANCDQLTEVSHLKPETVAIGGGLAQSAPLVRMLSDILGRPLACAELPHVTSCGAAMCAAVGAGIYPNLEVAAGAMRPQSRVIEPNEQNTRQYTKYYDRWVRTSTWLENLIEEIG